MRDNSFVVSLYIRVSTDQQAKEGDSLEEQESELRKFCDYKGFEILHVFIERGKSGGNTNRPEYQRLIQDVKQQKINAVVVKKLDRLSRSLMDFEAFMTLLQEHNVEFISLRESFDTSSAMGKAMLRVTLTFAQLEREQTSERLVDVLEYRASQGLYNGGTRPFGYTNVNKEIVPYPKERAIVELMFKCFLDTPSTAETARYLNRAGFLNRNNKPWDKRQIQKILQNPVYIGKVKWNGRLYAGIHQPIISDKQFETALHIFRQKTRMGTTRKLAALFQRLLFCGHCQSPMTPSHCLNKTKQRYYYYRCTSTQNAEKGSIACKVRYVSQPKLENAVINILCELCSEPLFSRVEQPANQHNEKITLELQRITLTLHQLEATYTQLKAKKDQYFDSLILGNFSAKEREVINKRIEEMELEEKQLASQIQKQLFDHSTQSESLINLSDLKKKIIQFKADHDAMTRENLKYQIQQLITRIDYHTDTLTLQLRVLPYPLDFPLLE